MVLCVCILRNLSENRPKTFGKFSESGQFFFFFGFPYVNLAEEK